MKTKKPFSQRHKILYAASLSLEDYQTNKIARRICMVGLIILIGIVIDAIV